MMMAIDDVDVSCQGITKVIRIYPEGNMDVQAKCDAAIPRAMSRAWPNAASAKNQMKGA